MPSRPGTRSLLIPDVHWAWLESEAQVRGLSSRQELVTALIEEAQAREATGQKPETGAPALQEMLVAEGQHIVAQVTESLSPVLEGLTLEAVQARMLATEQISYLYDKDQLVCPYCRKRYMDYQGAVTFAQERAQVVLQKAKDALAAGRVPRIRLW